MSGRRRNRWLTACYVTAVTFAGLMFIGIGLGWFVGVPIDVHSPPKGSEGGMVAALLGFWLAAPVALIVGGIAVFRSRND